MNKIKRTIYRIPSGSNSTTYDCDNFMTSIYHMVNQLGEKSIPISSIYSFGRWTAVQFDRKQVADILRHMKKVQKTS